MQLDTRCISWQEEFIALTCQEPALRIHLQEETPIAAKRKGLISRRRQTELPASLNIRSVALTFSPLIRRSVGQLFQKSWAILRVSSKRKWWEEILSAQGEPAPCWPPPSVLVWQSRDLKCKERSSREFKCKLCGFGVKVAQGGWTQVQQCGWVSGFLPGPWWTTENFPTVTWKITSPGKEPPTATEEPQQCQ